MARIGKVIQQLRVAQNLTQLDLAARAGVSKRFICSLERERSEVTLTLRSLNRIAQVLGVPAWKIVRYVERMEE